MNSQKLHLLVVDDEPTLRRLLALAFRPTRWALDECATADAAVQLLQARAYDVWLVDKNLPGMSSIDLIRQVRSTYGQRAIVAMTGYSSVASATELLHLGVSRLLEKPFEDIATVIRAVDASYEEQRSQGQSVAAAEHFRRAAQTLEAASAANDPPIDTLIVGAPSEDVRCLERLVRRESEHVATAATMEAALTWLERGRPELVLIDSSVAPEGVVSAVEGCARAMPTACIGVVAPRLSLAVISHLIALRVRVLIEEPIDERQAAARLQAVLADLGRRRHVERASVVNG